MTTGVKLAASSTKNNVSALEHLRNIAIKGLYVDYVEAEVQEELFMAEVVDTLLAVEILEDATSVVIVDGSTDVVIVEEILKGEQQC